jgi:chromosome segregation ATPase
LLIFKILNCVRKDALQTDLNGLRSDYDSLKVNFKELKKGGHHHHHHHSQHQLLNTSTSPISTKTSISNNNNNNNNNTSPATNLANIQQIENESLEEDMRKAKESADMLRSVVLPLETEITTLRSRSNTSEQRIKELEQLIDEVDYYFKYT